MGNFKLSVHDYAIGWVCALPEELVAALESMDDEHDDPDDRDTSDSNSYSFGRVGAHNIVVATLPSGQYGAASAATVAARMQIQFKALRFGLMVGIGGGVPSPNDVRLGDIVVSQPNGQSGGVLQYDMGKAGLDEKLVRTGILNAPPAVLCNALGRLRANYLRRRSEIPQLCAQLEEKLPYFAHPGGDHLYKADYPHPSINTTCENCLNEQLVCRTPRANRSPILHFGTIASGNLVIKDGIKRDELSRELGGVLCYEMEAAGLMNNFPCIVVRGICDYADSHKNKDWQPYAAMTAAACAKELLSLIPAAEVMTTAVLEEQVDSGASCGTVNIGTMNSGGGPQVTGSTFSGANSQFSWNSK